jgi:hypothetical protein
MLTIWAADLAGWSAAILSRRARNGRRGGPDGASSPGLDGPCAPRADPWSAGQPRGSVLGGPDCQHPAGTMSGPGWAVQQKSTATGPDASGPPGTRTDADLRLNTAVDVLPVVCKQGVRGSSPLSSTGQRHNSNSRAESTAAKYSNRDRLRCRTRVRIGLCLAGGGAQIPGLGPQFRATEQEERLWEGPVPLARRPTGSVLNLPFQGRLLPLKQRGMANYFRHPR